MWTIHVGPPMSPPDEQAVRRSRRQGHSCFIEVEPKLEASLQHGCTAQRGKKPPPGQDINQRQTHELRGLLWAPNFGPTLWVRTTSGRCFGVSFGAQKSIRCCATLSKVLTNLLRELRGFHIDTKWHSTSANIPASAPSLKPLSSSTSLA